jgi:hypothetical protein
MAQAQKFDFDSVYRGEAAEFGAGARPPWSFDGPQPEVVEGTIVAQHLPTQLCIADHNDLFVPDAKADKAAFAGMGSRKYSRSRRSLRR